MRRNLGKGALVVTVALWVMMLGKAADQKPEQEAIIRSFKQYAGDFVKHWNAKHSAPVVSQFQLRPSAPKLWLKTYFVSVKDYDIDVKTTDSLINPYVGVINFTQVWASSRSYSTRDEAEKSKDCGGEKRSSEETKDCSEGPKAHGTPEAFDCTPKVWIIHERVKAREKRCRKG